MKKKFSLLFFTLLIGVTTFASTFTENSATNGAVKADPQTELRLEQIKNRVEEIKNMDRSQLTRQERKELRNELKSMKQQARAMGGGIYLSVGAIIIIILLLILIL